MFNKELPEGAAPPEQITLPPLCTITITLVDDTKLVLEGHQIEFMTFGGVMVYRYYDFGNGQILQKLLKALAPLQWKAIDQTVDVPQSTRLVH